MPWTSERPTEPGYYWFHHPLLGTGMATVLMRDFPDDAGVGLHMISDLGHGWIDEMQNEFYRWCGPLNPPEFEGDGKQLSGNAGDTNGH